MLRLVSLTSCALVLAFAGCGSDDSEKSSDSGSSGDGGGSAKPQSGGSGGAKAGTKVSMKDIKFVPMNVTIKQGQTVEWTNNDSVTHNVTKESGPGPEFKSSNLNGGDTYKFTFKTAGKFDYVCTIHPNQTGSVTVQ